MKRNLVRFIGYCLTVGLMVILTIVITSCSSTSTSIPLHTPPSTPSRTLSSITVIPSSPDNLVAGSTTQFVAIGTYSDGESAIINSLAIWTSSNPDAATISFGGIANGVAAGNTDIEATMWGVTSPPVNLTVVAPTTTPSTTATTTATTTTSATPTTTP